MLTILGNFTKLQAHDRPAKPCRKAGISLRPLAAFSRDLLQFPADWRSRPGCRRADAQLPVPDGMRLAGSISATRRSVLKPAWLNAGRLAGGPAPHPQRVA